MGDIHNRDSALTTQIDNLQDTFSETNLELLEQFTDHLKAEGLSKDRIIRYLSSWNTLGKHIEQPLDHMDQHDIKKLVGKINQDQINDKEYSPWTKAEFKKAVRKFFQWDTGEDEPELIEFINVHVKRHKRKSLDPDTLLEPRHVKELVQCATNNRDKTLIFLLWETGARIEELLNLRWQDVKFGDELTKLKFQKSKSQPRQVPIKEAAPILQDWHHDHPDTESPEQYVFVNLTGAVKQMTYSNVSNILRKTRKKAELPEILKTNPHHFRKSRATYLAGQGWNAPQLCQQFGWSDFKTAKTYINLAKQDLENAFKEMHGMTEQEDTEDVVDLDPVRCPSCETVNGVDRDLCQDCGQPLESNPELFTAAQKDQIREETMSDVITELLDEMGMDEDTAKQKTEEMIEHSVEQRLEERGLI